MRVIACLMLAVIAMPVCAENSRVFLLSKRQIVETTHTEVVFFYDKGVTSMADCNREIQRGIRGQWRYYHHKFSPKPRGYMERSDYFCVRAPITVDAWYSKAPYDFIYQVDVRQETLKLRRRENLNECLHQLRKQVKDESHKFFCARLSQKVRT